MSKAEINNEIVLMRKNVEQAKVHVINKLSRDAFKLRKKKGTEAQKCKNLRKADRISAEILAIKKIKEDEVTKAALTNILTLEEVLKNRQSAPLERVTARIIHNKKFSMRISEFKKNYPNFKNFLGPGQRKKLKLEQKEKKILKKKSSFENISEKADTIIKKSSDESCHDESDVDNNDSLENNNLKKSQNLVKKDLPKEDVENLLDTISKLNLINNKKKLKKFICKQNKEKENIEEKGNHKSLKEEEVTKKIKCPVFKVDKNLNKKENFIDDNLEKISDSIYKENIEVMESNAEIKNPKKTINKIDGKKENKNKKGNDDKNYTKIKIKKEKGATPKVISKEAIVKKFSDIAKEDSMANKNTQIDIASQKLKINVETEVDPFFMTANGESNYLSVTSLKKKLEDTEETEGKHFNKFNKNNRKYHNDQEQNYSFNKNSKFKNLSSSYSKPDSNWNNQYKSNSKLDFDKFKPKWQNQQTNDKFDKRDRKDYLNKFNEDGKHNKNSFKKREYPQSEEIDDKVLHPSWLAKKKQQEMLKEGLKVKAKIIKFD